MLGPWDKINLGNLIFLTEIIKLHIQYKSLTNDPDFYQVKNSFLVPSLLLYYYREQAIEHCWMLDQSRVV